ncbi:MAG: dolichyl-diphosphooligosaccharide--protein glycosyltransferase subunit1 [Candidatus Bathyarchaeota archaeon B24]|nr:MAG: dolichyl-diphosphooligosaccharide--protein glycosyltransferase subunit1 [Candidatus Bathyarchaeota archaeon B24]
MLMKSIVSVMIFMVFVFILLPVSAPGYCVQPLKYSRHIEVYANGLLTFNDTISGVFQDVSQLSLTFPQIFIENLLDLKVQTDKDIVLETRIVYAGNVSRIEVLDIPPDTSVIAFEAVFDNGVWKRYLEYFNVSVPIYPGLNIPVEDLSFKMYMPAPLAVSELPQNFTLNSGDNVDILEFSASDLESGAMKTESIMISGLTLLKVERLSRVVTVSEFGDVMVEDFYTVINLGKSTVSRIDFMVPLNASEFGAKDEFGSLQTSNNRAEDYIILTVRPRYSLDEGDRYSFTVFYKLPAGALVDHSLLEDIHTLTLRLDETMPVVVKTLNVSVRLPEHSTVLDAEPPDYEVAKDMAPTVTWVLTRESSPVLSMLRNPPTVRVKYRYNVLWVSFKPALWVSLILAAVAAFYGFQRLRGVKPVEAAPEAKPAVVTEDVLSFVKFYEEKLRVRRQVARLEEDYRAGKISRVQYRTRLSRLRRRIAELDRMIESRKPSVRSAGYSEELNLIEEAEADISICDVGLRELRSRYRAGKVSRQVYERLSSEYLKRMRRSEGRIRRVLASMAPV